MKSKRKLKLTLLLLFLVQISFGQEITVSGNVTDQSGLPLPGVSVVVKNTTNGTETDFDGNFSINTKVGETLVFSFVGMLKQEIIASSSKVNVKMAEDTQILEGVVLTGQGIKREKQAVGYAISEVKSEALEQRAEGDIGRVLNGKASGVLINQTSGLSGSGTNIVIRGLNSITGSNQPLFIVDGVPFSSDTNTNGDFVDGNSGSSRFLDLDPNNIENVSVLKGLAAATLYGSAGKNGVILITTKSSSSKKGPKKNEVTITQSYFNNEIASLPDYQNKFGNGFDQSYGLFFSNWGPGFYQEGLGGWGDPNSGVASDATIAHPYDRASLSDAFPEFAGARLPWRPYDNVKDFFRTGHVSNTSVNLSGTSDDGKVSYNANYGHLNDVGFTPGNELTRNNIGIGGRAVLTNKFTVSGTFNYSRTDFVTPPVAASQGSGVVGDGSSIFGDVFYTPRSIDLMGMPFQNPLTGGSVYYRSDNGIQNPRWTAANSYSKQITNRVFGNTAVQYTFNDNLNLIYRVGLDFYNERNEVAQNKGGVTGNPLGSYRTFDNNSTIWDHNLVLNGDYELNEKFGMSFNLGATSRRTTYDRQGVNSENQLVFGVLRHFNFTEQSPVQLYEEQNILGLYGQTEIDFNKYLYLTLAGRNDWVSNFNNNSIFYPSASMSFIPTKAISGISSEGGLNFLKLRASYGTSAGFATGYPTSSILRLNARTFLNGSEPVPGITSATELGNPDLKPERYDEIELGFESKFFNNRVSLDVSYYNRNTKNLITDRPLPASTGFLFTQTNIGRVQGSGFEVDLGIDLFKNDNPSGFNWYVNGNFTQNETEVKELTNDSEIIVYSGFTNLGNAAIVGQPLGVIVGNAIQRDENGNYVVNSIGNYIEDPNLSVLGDPNPDWVLNVGNTIKYKNFNFNFLVSYVHGGNIYSETIATLLGRGLTTDTEDRLNTFILPGVNESGGVNDFQINASGYYFDNLFSGPDEMRIFDASVVRLQEISLGYEVPKKWLDNTFFGGLSFTLTGNNLWYKAINTPEGVNFDPNVAGTGVGNGRGFDYLNGPSSRRYGFSVKASF